MCASVMDMSVTLEAVGWRNIGSDIISHIHRWADYNATRIEQIAFDIPFTQ